MFYNSENIGCSDTKILAEIIKLKMSAKRFVHTMGVVKESYRLSEIYGLDEDSKKNLITASYLHDITKEADIKTHKKILETYGVGFNEDFFSTPKILHSLTGMVIAEFEYKANREVCSAIYNHTTGSSERTFPLIDKLLYISDFIEENREFDICVAVRNYFQGRLAAVPSLAEERQNIDALDDTLIFALILSIKDLKSENGHIHKNTVKCLEYLTEEQRNKSR